jgi:hypothetical protein
MTPTSTTNVLVARSTLTQNKPALIAALLKTYSQLCTRCRAKGEQHEIQMPQQTQVHRQGNGASWLADGQRKTGLI